MFHFSNLNFDRLVVLQSGIQARHYQIVNRQIKDLILPIGPEAMYETEINGWSYCSLGDLWTHSQYEKDNKANQKRIESLIEDLNSYSRRWRPNLGLEIGNYYAFQLLIIIKQILHNNFIIRSIGKNMHPEKVLCYTKSNSQTFLGIRPDPECIFSEVLSRSALNNNGRCEIIKLSETVRHVSRRQKMLSLLPVSLKKMFRKLRTRKSNRSKINAKFKLLLIGASGDWQKLIRFPVFSEFFSLNFVPEFKPVKKIEYSEEVIEILNASIKKDDLIPYDMSMLGKKIQTDLSNFADCIGSVDAVMAKNDAVVTAVFSFPIDSFFAHRAIVANLPVIVWQHGERGQSPFDPIHIYTELLYGTDYLAYADVVVDQYEKWIGNYNFKNAVTVGSIEKNVEWKGGESVVYATGKWFKTTLPTDPDRRLFKTHMIILDYLEQYGKVGTVIFKANNTPRLNEIPYHYKNIKIEYDATFIDCLKTAKLIILDTPATTLIEACSTKIPIFALNGRTEYLDEFLDVVKKRVVWCDTPEELVRHLDKFLKTGFYPASVNDTSFVSKYGCANSPPIVAEAVKNAVWNSIQRSRSEVRGVDFANSSK